MIKAFKANRPIVANNRAEMAALGLRTVPGTEPSLSTAQMPFFAGDRFLGTIALDNHERENAYGEAEVRLLSTVAASMGMALQNARNFDETQRLLKETERRIVRAGADQRHPARAGRASWSSAPSSKSSATSCAQLFGSDDIGITWRDEKTELIHNLYIVERGQRLQLPPFNDDPDGAMARAWSGGKPLVLKDRAIDAGLRHPHVRRAPNPADRSVFMPVMVGQRLRAAIRLVSLEREDAFDDATVNLLSTVAASMGVALEKARLFNETREALQRQTATAEVLRVLGRSMTDTQPVFDAIVHNCGGLFDDSRVVLLLIDGGRLRARASNGGLPSETIPLDHRSPIGACVVDAQTVHLKDLEAAADQYPLVRNFGLKSGFRTGVYAPLVHDGRAIGGLAVLRRLPGSFTDKDVALLGTFTDQAVIAIENVRLFNETQEALERQTATAEILKVIASSPNDVQPVFDVMVERAVTLCGAHVGRVYRYDGSLIRMVATRGIGAEWLSRVPAVFPRPAGDDTIVGQVIRTRQPYFVSDIVLAQDPPVPEISRQMILALGTRSQLTVPMLRHGEPIGAITLGWLEPDAFDDTQLALLQTFADQAVIAIENVRLFNETKEALEQQTDLGRGAAGDQQFGGRHATGVRAHPRRLPALVCGQLAVDLPVRRGAQADAAGRAPRCRPRGARPHLPAAVARRTPADPAAARRPGAALRQRARRRRCPARRAPRGRVDGLRQLLAGLHATGMGRTRHRCAGDGARTARALRRARTRPAQELRRPGGDRHPERAAVQRNQGSARTPDCQQSTS